MKRTLLFLPVLLGLAACSPVNPANTNTQTDLSRYEYPRESNIAYLRDRRTNVCFGYVWGGLGNGGPATFTVPCDSVKKLSRDLLP